MLHPQHPVRLASSTPQSCKHVTGTSTKKVCHKKCTVGLDVSKKTVTASLSAGANKAASTSSSATATAAAATPAVTVKADTDGRRRLLNGKGASLPSLPSMGKGPVSVSVSVPEIKPDVVRTRTCCAHNMCTMPAGLGG